MESYPDFLTVTRYGYADGLKGVNCRHDFFGTDEFMPPNYTDEELADIREKEEEKHPFETTDRSGNKIIREYTNYEATQRMRSMETAMRKQRALAAGYKASNNEEDYNTTKTKYRRQMAEYKRFCEAMGMKTDLNSRVYIDSLGRI